MHYGAVIIFDLIMENIEFLFLVSTCIALFCVNDPCIFFSVNGLLTPSPSLLGSCVEALCVLRELASCLGHHNLLSWNSQPDNNLVQHWPLHI